MTAENETGRPGPPTGAPPRAAGPGLSADDLITLNEELAGLARAGLPLEQGLAALAKEMGRGRLRDVTAALAADLHAGHPLPAALERQAGRVPPFYAGLVAAGIRSGRVGDVLATLTAYARTLADLRATVVGAVLYPAVVAALAFLLFGFVTFYLVPQFERIFQDLRVRLPWITRVFLALSHQPVALFLVPPVALVGGLVLVRLLVRRGERGRVVWARGLYAVPLVGPLVRAARLAAFSDLLGVLVDHGLPLPEALRLAGAAASDPLLAAASRRVADDLGRGAPLGEALGRTALVPQLFVWMAGLGERRGALGPALHQLADMYRRQVVLRAALLRTVLPPVLVFATAGVLLGIFVATLGVPLFTLFEQLSR